MNFLPERPQRIGETLDAGFRLYRTAFKKVVPLSLIAMLFSALPQAFPDSLSHSFALLGGAGMMALTLGVFLVASLASMPFSIACIAILGSVAGGQDLSTRGALGIGIRRLIPVFISFLLYGLAVVAGSLLLIIPGIIVMVSMMLGSYALILDKMGPVEALSKSHSLVWGNWWRTTIVAMVPGIVAMMLMFLFQMPFMFLMDGQAAMMIGVQVGNVIGLGLGMPMFYAVMLIYYYDLKLRSQGEDLEARINSSATTA